MKYRFPCVSCYVFLSFLFASAVAQEKIRLNIGAGQNALDLTDKDLSKAETTEKPPSTTAAITSTSISIPEMPIIQDIRAKNVPAKLPKLVCPGKEVPRPFFSLPCARTKDCAALGRGLLCCDRRCLKGVQPPKPEPKHAPMFFGFIERVCPVYPLAEIWQIKECQTDEDCVPRICCPETLRSGENVSYCRTAQPLWDRLPAAKRLMEPVRNLVSYMQCTPPLPPILDLFPKPCQTPLDCFPNLCCQEGGNRFCRPPRRSILSLIAGIGQRLIPAQAARGFIQRIS